jgi:pyruvate kinase
LEADACLPVPGYWLSQLRCTDSLKFKDARGSSRTLKVVDVTADGCWAEARKTAYVIPGTVLRQRRKEDHGRETRATVGRLPALEDTMVLKRGDLLVLFRDLEFGRAASLDSRGEVLSPAMVGLPIPQVFEDVRLNDPVCFDDGRIVGNIEKAEAGRLHVRITRTTRPEGNRLGSYKGINFPESRLHLAAMTELDIEHLEFVCRHADMIALSFANEVSDLQLLESHIDRLDGKHPGIVLKIETRRGFENLPDMLLEAMKSPPCGVMIARGDLAVECGFERLAEVQEEILWLCEAAHVPVIWATQVLDHMAKTGLPSRAEISDAAMGQGADCVMLNKGKHIVKAVQALDSILVRMQGHQSKKQSMLRELNLASNFRDR